MLCLSGFQLYSRWVPLTIKVGTAEARRLNWAFAKRQLALFLTEAFLQRTHFPLYY